MISALRRPASAAIVLALVLALTPSAAFATQPRRARRAACGASSVRSLTVRPAVFSGPSVPSWARDAYDQHSQDDTPGGARDLTAFVAGLSAPNGFGRQAYEEAHTFWVASSESTPGAKDYAGDQDWFKFTASAGDAAMGKPYTIEARAGNAWVFPVIEVYGPTSAATISPTPPEASLAGTTSVPDPAALAVGANTEWYVVGSSSSVTFSVPDAGTYFVRVRPYFDGSGAFAVPPYRSGYDTGASGAGPYTLRFKAGEITRLWGTDRVKTAIALSRERYADGELPLFDWSVGGTGSVVVASGYNFPDALAGSTLAGAVGGPLLLTHPTFLDADVKAEIVRLGAHRVFILGGTAALSDGVKRALEAVPGVGAGHVFRVSGNGRVQTAVAVAKKAGVEFGGVAPVAFVANGYSFPDALAASPMAAYNVAPILLTHKDYLDGDTLAAFDQLGTTDVVILGSVKAVGTAVESRLNTRFGAAHVKRIGGADRYETAQMFAVWETGSLGATQTVGCLGTLEENKLMALDWSRFAVAAGWNYPDALGGGAFAGYAGYPLLLSPPGEQIPPRILDIQGVLPAGGSYLSLTPGPGYVYDVGRSYVLGASSVVSDGLWRGLDPLVGMP
ncbi:MAG TPA: cell wall-binding repeat-containing protein [Coriobacteriia bacterium]|jgi:hypothetical protein